MPGRYQFSLPQRRQRDGWFRIGTFDFTTTAVLTALAVLSIFYWAADKVGSYRLAFTSVDVRDGDVWRLFTWPIDNPLDGSFAILRVLAIYFFWVFSHHIEEQIGRKPYTVIVAIATVVPTAIVTLLDVSGSFAYSLTIFGLAALVVFALDTPNAMFFFGIPAWILAAVYVAVDVLRYLSDGLYGALLVELLAMVVFCVGARQYGMLSDTLAFVPVLRKQGRATAATRKRGKAARRGSKATASSVITGPWQTSGSQTLDQIELDHLLDKISANGIESLTKAEKNKLNELSKRLRGS